MRPTERVIFWPKRDANPFFHLYESLWMLAGRNDLKPLQRYVKDFDKFSDDGETLAGAYGYRWRIVFDPLDQLVEIAKILRANHDDRRCVLQFWDANYDLGSSSKDVPCNVSATVQVNVNGALELTVFCRSNYIVLGAYGANAVHLSFLQEYLAHSIGVPVGPYRQVSVNWHAYLSTVSKFEDLGPSYNPYADGSVRPLPLKSFDHTGEEFQRYFDRELKILLALVDSGFTTYRDRLVVDPVFNMFSEILRAHHVWKTWSQKSEALSILASLPQNVDWVRAATEWLLRRP
jgi:thymidylate synthase